MNDGWFDDDLWDEDDLLAEFDKLLKEESSYKTNFSGGSTTCSHDWVEIGRSPVLDEPWINCKKCGISKETYDKRD